jgi:zinc protease
MSLKISRNKKPPQLRKLKFNLPVTVTFKLENGLPVYFVHKNTLPFLNLTLVADAGSKHDPAGKKGLSNLFAMTVDEGAGEYDSLQLSDEFEILGAGFNVSSDQDSAYFSLQILKDGFERGLELFSKIITESRMDEGDFKREQRKIMTRILQNRDEPDEIANEVFEKKIFGNNNSYAFPTIGYENDIEKISVQDVREFYNKILDPSKAFLVIVGDYDTGTLKTLLNKRLSGWKNKSSINTAPAFNSSNLPGLYIVDKKDSVQSEIRTGLISYKRCDYDFYARNILNLILGGQFTSRLNLNLRENKGFTYGIISRFIYLKSSAYFYVSTSVSSGNTGAALYEIFNELKKVRGGITKKELEFAKSSIIRKFPSGFETYNQIASNITAQIIHSLPDDYFKTYIDEIRSVTVERVLEAAENNIFPDKLTTVIVGNKEGIIGQLEKNFNQELTELDVKGEERGKL